MTTSSPMVGTDKMTKCSPMVRADNDDNVLTNGEDR
jgi:hypothetical protein